MKRVLKVLLLIILVAVGGVVTYVYAFPEHAAAGAVNAERERSTLVRKQITLPNGLQYVYLEGGQGQTLLLLHGFGANKDNFTRVARFLVPYYKVVIPDHIGFGESSHLQDADYAPPAQAERLHAFTQALNLGAVHIGGSSMGGHIAATYAAKYPDEVLSLWLLNAGGAWSAPKSELSTRIEAGEGNPLLAQNEDQFAEIFSFVMAEPPFIPRPILNVFAQDRIKNYELERRIFDDIRGDSVEERIAGLKTPTLIVFGELDRAIHPGAAEVYHKLLPNSQVIIMPGIGHLPMLENPQQTAHDYLVFNANVK